MDLSTPRTRTATPAAHRLDWAVALGGLWMMIGLHLDGWAHHHIQLENFFTPWHAVLYSGYAFSAAAVGLAWLNGLRQGRAWFSALSPAHRLTLTGAILFLFGGLADMTWHTLLGIENSIEALLSPPHLFLALGGGLLISGPLRAAMARPPAAGIEAGTRPTMPFPALISLAALLSLLAFFTSYASPWYELTDRALNPNAFGGLAFRIASGGAPYLITAILLQSALLMGSVLLALRAFRLPFGALTFLLTLTTLLGAAIHTNWGLGLVGLLGGLAGDALVALLGLNQSARQPGLDPARPLPPNLIPVPVTGPALPQPRRVRLFAFLLPAILYLVFFSLLRLFGSLTWSLELWSGATLLAGAAGWLLSFAVFPSPVPVNTE